MATLSATTALFGAKSPDDIKGYAPVAVSGANYRDASSESLHAQINAGNQVNPSARELKPLATPQHFVFMRGEIFEADLDYDTICRYLTPELAKKNYLNAADAQGRIYAPEKVTLLLRVTYGVLLWRNPVVHSDRPKLSDGLIGRVKDSRSLTHLGGDRVWDSRGGGEDNALSLSGSSSATRDGTPWSGNGGVTAGSPAAIAADRDFAYTRDFNLIVIDAFDYAETKAKGTSAKVLWTTLISAPVQRGEKYSQALPAMLRVASGYWGETTSGLQIFNDARARVEIGEVTEMKDSPPEKK